MPWASLAWVAPILGRRSSYFLQKICKNSWYRADRQGGYIKNRVYNRIKSLLETRDIVGCIRQRNTLLEETWSLEVSLHCVQWTKRIIYTCSPFKKLNLQGGDLSGVWKHSSDGNEWLTLSRTGTLGTYPNYPFIWLIFSKIDYPTANSSVVLNFEKSIQCGNKNYEMG